MTLPDRYTGPGLVDLQMNGFAGFDFNSQPDTWTLQHVRFVADRMRRRGMVAALPTLITDDEGRMIARARRYAELLDEDPLLRQAFPALHIEGPFISAEEGPRGVHPPRYCTSPRALPNFLAIIREASRDRVGVVTLAPELAGAAELIVAAREAGICVAVGHTAASAMQIAAAVEAGARLSTHLGNGSHQMLPRLDNYVLAQLGEDRLAASFIADGHHLPFFTLKSFIRAKTLDRSILVSDATAAADIGPGRYLLGSEEIVVSSDLRVSSPGQENLAGSALTLDRAVVNVTACCGLPFEDAWAMASTRPAALLGLPPPPEVTVRVSSAGFEIVG